MTERKFIRKLLTISRRRGLSDCLMTSAAGRRYGATFSLFENHSTTIDRRPGISSRNLSTISKASMRKTRTRNNVIECKRGSRMINYHSIALEGPSQVGCPGNHSGRNLKELIGGMAKEIKERIFWAMEQGRDKTSEDCRAGVKSYDRIPGPKGIPFLGSALEYTMFGKFSPKEYHKALEHRHNK